MWPTLKKLSGRKVQIWVTLLSKYFKNLNTVCYISELCSFYSRLHWLQQSQYCFLALDTLLSKFSNSSNPIKLSKICFSLRLQQMQYSNYYHALKTFLSKLLKILTLLSSTQDIFAQGCSSSSPELHTAAPLRHFPANSSKILTLLSSIRYFCS